VRDFVTIRVANFMNNLLAVLLLALPLIAFLSAGIIELRSERSATQKVLSCLPAFLGVLVTSFRGEPRCCHDFLNLPRLPVKFVPINDLKRLPATAYD